jgi:hypothetical protein
MSGPCGVNPVTGYCDICQCYSAEIDEFIAGSANKWYCVGAHLDQDANQRHRDEEDLMPEEELEFR